MEDELVKPTARPEVDEPIAVPRIQNGGIAVNAFQACLSRMLRIEWLGQTVASISWIASVLAYGISSTGDWLQFCAASAWLLANIASIVPTETE